MSNRNGNARRVSDRVDDQEIPWNCSGGGNLRRLSGLRRVSPQDVGGAEYKQPPGYARARQVLSSSVVESNPYSEDCDD